MERLALPSTLEALRLRRIAVTSDVQDAYVVNRSIMVLFLWEGVCFLPINQEGTMSPQPAVTGRFSNRMFAIRGGMVRNIIIKHLLLGRRMQPKMPIQMATI